MNPAPYTIITFPFLFAVMFGDIGHGLIMALFGWWMVQKERIIAINIVRNEIFQIMFAGRYVILLMGLFSIYAGILYNDMFGCSLNFFGSGWDVRRNVSSAVASLQLDPRVHYDKSHPTYPIGLDPVWQVATNKIIFQNALKMKMSIVLGVVHMLFGLVLSLVNCLNFRNRPAIWCEFVPQVLFLSSLFVYLAFLMILKWIKYSAENSALAPSILLTFIDMLMFKPANPANFMFAHQDKIQSFLIALALICTPWMWLAKPLYIVYLRKVKTPPSPSPPEEPLPIPESLSFESVQHSTESISEIFMHQSIHTIEFVLGSISHTASYLRLWALSLAHSQLAEVLWSMVLRKGLQFTGPYAGVFLMLIFAFWAAATVSILVIMEGLSAFLHTLRLHWVEFQSKFYVGQGYAFIPFTFKDIVREVDIKT